MPSLELGIFMEHRYHMLLAMIVMGANFALATPAPQRPTTTGPAESLRHQHLTQQRSAIKKLPTDGKLDGTFVEGPGGTTAFQTTKGDYFQLQNPDRFSEVPAGVRVELDVIKQDDG